ncbi:tape measure protein [Vibrio phage 1.170.O._10N.261.52.C3]|nr:tape measure protein [Vibrio phage 1.170.O._10N.261.52.C3]
MAENIQSYKISLELEKTLGKLNKLKQMRKRMHKFEVNSLKAQISLQKQLNGLRGKGDTGTKPTVPTKQPRVSKGNPNLDHLASSSLQNKASKTAFADQLRAEESAEKQVSKELAKQEASRLRVEKISKRQAQALEDKLHTVKNSSMYTKMEADSSMKVHKAALDAKLSRAKSAKEVQRIVREQQRLLVLHKQSTKQLQKQNFLVQRMTSSSKQFAGNMVGAFAVAAGAGAVTTVGQDFEAVRNTMLAVSEDSEAAGENFKYARNEAYRLGLGLKESAKGYAKLIAARGDMSMTDVQNLFTGTAEMSTLLGLSAEENKRSINAVMQMASKGNVTAEELKLQLGEVMPNALQLMSLAAQDAGISVTGTYKELQELQVRGEVISSKVLPHFARRMSEAAQANGGLEAALKSNRVAMNRFMFAAQEAADKFFKSGFAEGLTEFFQASSDFLVDNGDLWESLGKIIGSVLKGVSKIISALNPIVQALGTILRSTVDALGDFSGWLVAVFTPFTYTLLPAAIKGVGGLKDAFKGLAAFIYRALIPLTTMIMLLEEIALFFNNPDNKKTYLKDVLGINKDDIAEGKNTVRRINPEEGFSWENAGVIASETIESVLGNAFKIKKNMSTPNKDLAGSNPYLQLQVDVNIDGEKVGEAVMDTESADNTINRKVSDYITGNY